MSLRVRVAARVGELQLDVEIDGEGEPLVLVGPNGSGKTTLLRIIAGALTPTEGEISLTGQTLFCSQRGINLPSEERHVGYLPQGYGLFPHLSALDNVAFGLSTRGRSASRNERQRRAGAMLDDLGCAELAERLPTHLSGGERQRVALARALVIEPKLLLLDEPLAALDASAKRSLRSFLAARLRRFARPTLVVTHDVRDALSLGARVCVLERGHIVQRGDVAALRAAPASDFVAELVGAD